MCAEAEWDAQVFQGVSGLHGAAHTCKPGLEALFGGVLVSEPFDTCSVLLETTAAAS